MVSPSSPLSKPDTSQADVVVPISPSSRLLQWILKLRRAFSAVHVSHRGYKYSIERLLALDEYTRTASLPRVLLVCVGTPLPMMMIVFSQENIPLQNIEDGWSANVGFWIRTAILGGAFALAAAVQMSFLLGFTISRCQMGLMAVFSSLGSVLAPILVAIYYTFPTPFMLFLTAGPTIIVLVCSFRFIVGRQIWDKILSRRNEFARLTTFFSAQSSLVFIYPVYQVLFNAVVGTKYELPTILLLPVIKITMQNIIAHTLVHVDDVIPESVAFSVNFFHATYVATFMQTSSNTAVTLIIAIDFVQIARVLLSLRRGTSGILHRMDKVTGSVNNLLSAVCMLCRCPQVIKKLSDGNIQRDSLISHHLSTTDASLLASFQRLSNDTQRRLSTTAIMPMQRETPTVLRSSQVVQTDSREQQLETIEKALKLFFTSECVVLTEYLESMIPIFYGIFMLVMVHVPSARYHIELADVTKQNVSDTAERIFVYALLEIASFLMLVVVTNHYCNIQILHHLAFVLESQMPVIQIKMIVWMLMTMSFRVIHFGVDFTFRFSWMAHNA